MEETLRSLHGEGSGERTPFDYFHINSVDKDENGRHLISSRYLNTVTCIESTGEVCWTLGGKRNEFADLSNGTATSFKWQHPARWRGENTVSVFDNQAYDRASADADRSRGMLIHVRPDEKTATLLQSFPNPRGILSLSQGSMQLLPSGNVLLGWGLAPGFTEYSSTGEVLCDAHFGAFAMRNMGWVTSYRVFKAAWVGRPRTRPEIRLTFGKQKKKTAFVSWNGATQISFWRLESTEKQHAAEDNEFVHVQTVPKKGFEGSLPLPAECSDFVRVAALDSEHKVLGYTDLVNQHNGILVSLAYTQ